ncbi:uncharacterized protein LOC132901739 [Amyelois transitella]|uniref:uncharacterized protein LOC106133374 n=1 Tax=Amyelois transitella TaxID=680683 RepID=UPI00067B8EBF|nr:uncharacterized protein LOC106133374 [Amyelois transitella]XP_013194103.1 uncharacterized protein LOC106137746 [Amyelois transitella]XP_060810120.1 uncharacterized protein LOC132901739 [Amyelois transitella]
MEKLKFEFVVKPAEDPKTNIMCITSIMDADKNTFLIPEQLQSVKLHDVVIQTKIFQKVRTTLQRRHEKRQVWISVTPELRDAYMDEDGNMQFKGYLLEEVTSISQKQISTDTTTEALSRMLANFAESEKEPKLFNLKKLSEMFVIDKFTQKTSSATQWMIIFETECARMGINDDTHKIQGLRLFLDDSCQDWYSSMLIKYTLNSEWCIWKKNFCETYMNKGWTPVRYAFLFKYRQGSLLEYALKKERLLLETNKSIDKTTLINLIVTGLPNFIADEIDRSDIKETEQLFNSIRGLEHLNKKKFVNKEVHVENKIKEKSLKEKPCKICEKEKKGIRYHSESVCWFRNKNDNQYKKESIKSVNNSELEMSLNEVDPKN